MSAKKKNKEKEIVQEIAAYQSSEDYRMTIQPHPSYQQISIPTSNQFVGLTSNFPSLSYSQTVTAPQTPQQKLQAKSIATTSSSNFHAYSIKPHTEHLFLTPYTTDDISKDKILQICSSTFPSGFHWYPENPHKTQKFYEFILIDTGSILLTHTRNKSSQVMYSKCIIKKVLSVKDWPNQQNHYPQQFSQPFNPSSFTYHDYKEAWHRAFYLHPFSHTCFFMFHQDCPKTFPLWFFSWWQYFGPTLQILPPACQEGALHYIKVNKDTEFTRFLKFMAEFKVPWIFCWEYQLQTFFGKGIPLSMVRIYKVRWWEKYDVSLANLQNVKQFLQTGTKAIYKQHQIASTPAMAITDKSKAQLEPHEEIAAILASNPDIAKSMLASIKKSISSSAEQEEQDSVSSENSVSDPFGGPCSQDPYMF